MSTRLGRAAGNFKPHFPGRRDFKGLIMMLKKKDSGYMFYFDYIDRGVQFNKNTFNAKCFYGLSGILMKEELLNTPRAIYFWHN